MEQYIVKYIVLQLLSKGIYEAELISCSEGCDTAQFIVNVLDDLKVLHEESPKVRVDSEAVVKWIKGRSVTQYSKHLRPKYYGTRHVVRDGLVQLDFIAGKDNPADILTKILPLEDHVRHLKNILGHHLVKFTLEGVQTIFVNESPKVQELDEL